MSVASRTVITWRANARQQRCRTMRFSLPAEPNLTIAGILELLAPDYDGTEPSTELRERIESHVREISLPPAVLVSQAGEADDNCENLLTICTVLAKSSGAIYLRDKEPNLSRLTPGASLILHIPKTWRAANAAN
jgi:hypothetical protein